MIRNPQQLRLMRLGLPPIPANGGGGGNTTTTTKADPWSGQQPYLQNVFSGAQTAYDQYRNNPGSLVAGFTSPQQQAIGAQQQQFNQTNLNGAQVNNAAGAYTTNLLNGNYLNSNPGNSAFSQFASGNMLNNPYQAGALDAANNAITRAYQTATAPQTASAFAGSGRYGSGAYQNAVSQNQQDLATQLGNTDASLVNSMYQQNMGNMLQGAQGLSSNYNTAAQQQLQGSYNAPSIAAQSQNAIANLYNMGGNQQALTQQQINAPWDLLGRYNSLIQGNYGGSSSTSTPYYSNPVAGGLGGAMGGAATGAMLGSVVPGIGTAVGAIGGGLIGGLGGMFSDRRLKQDIEPTGERLENGLPIYRYRYVWDEPNIRRVGVMADDVRWLAPWAVWRDPSGFDKVDYVAIDAAHLLTHNLH